MSPLEIKCASAPEDTTYLSDDGDGEVVLQCFTHGKIRRYNHISTADARRLRDWLTEWLERYGDTP